MLDKLRAAKRASAPFIAIETMDVQKSLDGIVAHFEKDDVSIFSWDLAAGIRALNTSAKETGLAEDNQHAISQTDDPIQQVLEALSKAQELPPRTKKFGAILILKGMDRFFQDPTLYTAQIIQCVCNLKIPFQKTNRTLIFLGYNFQLPPELEVDAIVLDDPRPTREELESMLKIQLDSARKANPSMPEPKPEDVRIMAGSLVGLSHSGAEITAAMSMKKNGLDPVMLRERSDHSIGQIKGLKVVPWSVNYENLLGHNQIKKKHHGILTGRIDYAAIIFMDEMEKALAGTSSNGRMGDSNGISDDALAILLQEMQDNEYDGSILVGLAGTGKTLFAHAIAGQYQRRMISFDLGGMQGSLVGESEGYIRAAMKTIKAVCGKGGAYFVGTCNALHTVPAPLIRRFTKGIWYFDLPTRIEKDSMWTYYMNRYELSQQPIPQDFGWSGSNISVCCKAAWQENISLLESAESIVPIGLQDPQNVQQLRKSASGHFLSTIHPGPFSLKDIEQPTQADRAYVLED